MERFLKTALTVGLTAIACIILFSVYLKHCTGDGPIATTTEIIKWREADQRIKDSTAVHWVTKERFHDSERIVNRYVDGLSDSAAASCVDSIPKKELCRAWLTLPIVKGELDEANRILALDSQRIAMGDSLNDYLGKKVAKYQQDEKKAEKRLKRAQTVSKFSTGAAILFGILYFLK